MGTTHVDLVGMRFGRLVVLRRGDRNKSRKYNWECVCDCGNFKTAPTDVLRSGNTKSCGCLRREITAQRDRMRKKHGLSRTPEHAVWRQMMKRCLDERDRSFGNYGARGITVCKEWFDFERFLADMGIRPSIDHQIDRKDNGKGYSKENCRWVTRTQNMRNKRNTIWLILDGKKVTTGEASEKTGVKYKTIKTRLSAGLTQETGLFSPVTQPHQ